MHIGLNLAFLTPGTMGGLEVYSRQLAEALAARGDTALTLFLSRPAARDRSWGELGRTVVLGVDPARRVDWVRADLGAVPRAAARAGVDLVHSLASTGPALGRFRRVVTVHDLNYLVHPETHFGARALGMRALVPLAVRRSHRVIVPSRATCRDLVERLGADEARIDVVPEGVGQPARPGARMSAALERRLDGRGRPIALSVSAKRPHKNLRRLIAALALLPAGRRPLLVLPGYPTPHEAELRVEAEERGVGGDVRFLDWLSEDDLEALYASAACFVFPSLYEGFGLPVLEAMARGVPVATSGRASLAEVAGDAALLFDPEDERSIAGALARLLEDAELAGRLREQGRRQAARFSWAQAADGTVASYRRSLA
ncbi:MAG: glycosyltransferase family 4 protein [Thermoleophilaceae bacterium]